MLSKLLVGLENYLWGKVIQRMMGRVSAIEGREVSTGEIIDIEPVVSDALPSPAAPSAITSPTGTRLQRLTAAAEAAGYDVEPDATADDLADFLAAEGVATE